MMFEAKGREITLNQIRAREVAAETVEGDVIVPDVQGDIGKVLQVKASCAVESKEVNGERITLSGTVHAFVLYLPLGGGLWTLMRRLRKFPTIYIIPEK